MNDSYGVSFITLLSSTYYCIIVEGHASAREQPKRLLRFPASSDELEVQRLTILAPIESNLLKTIEILADQVDLSTRSI